MRAPWRGQCRTLERTAAAVRVEPQDRPRRACSASKRGKKSWGESCLCYGPRSSSPGIASVPNRARRRPVGVLRRRSPGGERRWKGLTAERGARGWQAQPESLARSASERRHQSEQFLAFHMLGDACDAEDVAQGDDRLQQPLGVRAMMRGGHEAAVELYLVKDQLAQIADRGIASAEIVQHDRRAGLSQLIEILAGALEVREEGGLGDLDLEPGGAEAGAGERLEDRFREAGRADLDRADERGADRRAADGGGAERELND